MTVINQKKSYVSSFEGQDGAFRGIYYTIACLNLVSAIIFLVGQTTGIFHYDLAAYYGFQEPRDEVGPSIVQVNRAFCTSDTILYIPLLISSAYGLLRKKRWALVCTSASAGISSYWSITVTFVFLFLSNNDVEGYTHDVSVEIWGFILFYIVYGIVVLGFLYHYWDLLFVVMRN